MPLDQTVQSLYASASLKGDPACTRDHALRSQWSGARTFDTAQGSEPCTAPANPYFWCERQRHVGSSYVRGETELWPGQSRMADIGYRRGYPQRETDLYGTAPYRARGDGVLRNVDASNSLQRMFHNQNLCCKRVTEQDWSSLRLSYQDVPNRTESYQRAGNPTRGSPAVMNVLPTLNFTR